MPIRIYLNFPAPTMLMLGAGEKANNLRLLLPVSHLSKNSSQVFPTRGDHFQQEAVDLGVPQLCS
jgi:hypothetical protein